MILPVKNSINNNSFCGKTHILPRHSRQTLESILSGYKQLRSSLDTLPQNELKKYNIELSRSIQIKNPDSTASITFKEPYGAIITRTEAQGKSESYSFKNFEFCETSEKTVFNEELLQNLLSRIDEHICRLRQGLSVFKAGALQTETTLQLEKIPEINNKINNILKAKTRYASDKLKDGFENYYRLSGQSVLVFKDKDLKISCAELINKQHGKFLRLIVWDKNNEIKDAFLIHGNKLVKNFNPKFYSVIPDNLLYYNRQEIPDKEKILNTYLESYSTNQAKFLTFITSAQRQGKLSSEIFKQLINLKKLYDETNMLFSKIPVRKQAEAKKTFSFFDKTSCRGRLRFNKVTTDGDSISYYPVLERIYPECIRLEITDRDKHITNAFLIHKNEYIVKNYTPEFQSQIPKKMEYMNEAQIQEALPVLEFYLPVLYKNMILFKTFVEMYCKKLHIL